HVYLPPLTAPAPPVFYSLSLHDALPISLIKDGKMYVQAGAGIVADSEPTFEQQECVNKAKALFRAADEARRFASGGKRGQERPYYPPRRIPAIGPGTPPPAETTQNNTKSPNPKNHSTRSNAEQPASAIHYDVPPFKA